MTTPCATSKSFWARRMLGFCRRARLTASASESGWGMKALVVDEEGTAWSGWTDANRHARASQSRAGGGRIPVRIMHCLTSLRASTALVIALSLIGITRDGLARYDMAAYCKVGAWSAASKRSPRNRAIPTCVRGWWCERVASALRWRSEEHTSELQSL